MLLYANMTIEEEIKLYADKINSGDFKIKYLFGVYGDTNKDTGIVVDDIFPKEGGAYNKLLGCSYLFKTCPFGIIPSALIELYGLAKKMVSRVVIDILQDKLILSFVLFLYIFQKKRFYKYLNQYTNILYNKVLLVIPFDANRFNKFQKELRRVNEKVFEGEKHKLSEPLKKIFEVIIYLLDFDTAYRFSAQDVLGQIDKNNEPIKEFKRLAELLEERYNDESCKSKAKQLKRLVPIFYYPYFNRLLTKFFKEINIEEVKLDEADIYFCLGRYLYNINGISIEERLKEKERIDKEKGHIKINFRPVEN